MVDGRYLLCRASKSLPLFVLELLTDGSVTGGSGTASAWRVDGENIEILSDDGTVFLRFMLPSDANGDFTGISSKSSTTDQVSYFLRRLGPPCPIARGPLPVQTESLEEARKFLMSRIDFSLILAPTALVPTAIERLYIDGCHLTTYQSFEFFQASYAADPVFIHFLHNAELINGNVVVRNDGVVVGETTYFSQQKGGSFGPATWAQMHEACIPASRPSVHHGKRPYFLLNTLEGNYGHWHLQTLSNVNAYKLASGLFEGKLGLLSLLGLGYEGFRPYTLAALGLDASEIVQAPRDLTHPFERHDLLIVPSTLEVPSAARFSPYLLESLAPLRRRSIGGSPDRLYLTRKDVADRRGIRNSEDLESSLASLGFRSVTTGHMSYDEELQAFANADMVVSPHGGGLTNMIAHAPGLKILELFHSLQMNPWYKNLAALCGHRYSAYCIDPPADEASSKGWNASFDVNVSRVTEAVRAMISG